MRHSARVLGREPANKMSLPNERKRYLTHLLARAAQAFPVSTIRVPVDIN
jgi:hypothetical protein